eukprot:15178-Heterococcus_DN1.PRE.8
MQTQAAARSAALLIAIRASAALVQQTLDTAALCTQIQDSNRQASRCLTQCLQLQWSRGSQGGLKKSMKVTRRQYFAFDALRFCIQHYDINTHYLTNFDDSPRLSARD